MSEHRELLIDEHNDWNVPENGALRDRYAIYLSCANDGNGNDSLTGEPLLTFNQWLNT